MYKPDARWPVLATNDVPDRDGWIRGKAYQYQTSPNEKRIVQAVTRFEVLYDGKPEADENVAQGARNYFATLAAERKLLTVPADPAEAGKLAAGYRNAALGEIAVGRKAGKTIFDFGEFKSEVATQRDPDGTISFVTLEPGIRGLAFVVGEAAGKPTLTLRDSQHEYVFTAR